MTAKTPHHDDILDEVCTAFGISRSELRSMSKPLNHCMARSVVCVLLEEAGYSQTQIAVFINRDRTNVWRYINVSHYKYLSKAIYAGAYKSLLNRVIRPS